MALTDTAGNTATVIKSFTVGNAAGVSPARSAASSSTLAAASGAAVLESGSLGAGSEAPVVKSGASYTTVAGGSFQIGDVSAPGGGMVSVAWTLMEAATGDAFRGTGTRVTVPASAAPGTYQILITSTNAVGVSGEGTARVTVSAARPPQPPRRPAPPVPVPAGAAGRQLLPPPPPPPPPALALPPAIYGAPLAATPRLPARTFAQGVVLEVDPTASGLFDLTSTAWKSELEAVSCTWMLSAAPSAGGAAAATVYGCVAPARFRLATAGMFTLSLTVTKAGKTAMAKSAIKVAAKASWSAHYSAASPTGFATGRCAGGRFSGTEFTPLSLACGGVMLPLGWGADLGLGGAKQTPYFAWTLTPLTIAAAASHKAPLLRSSVGAAAATFGAIAPGLYLAEVLAGGGADTAGSAASPRAAYFLSSLLTVEPASRLALSSPAPVCAGAAAGFSLPEIALLPGQVASPAAWSVAWLDARAATGTGLVLTGIGMAFGFVPQPGRYAANVTVDVTTGAAVRRLRGSASLDARPCIECLASAQVLPIMAASCAAAGADAAKLLAARPPWLGGAAAKLAFAPRSNLMPGTRTLVVVAASLGTNVTASCTARNVTVRDASPPAASLRRPGGVCAAPANGLWACWAAAAMVNATDNCEAVRPVQIAPACTPAVTGGPAGGAWCTVTANGRACVRAAAPASAAAAGWSAAVDVAVRDGYGNVRAGGALRVPIAIYRSAVPGCAVPALTSPLA